MKSEDNIDQAAPERIWANAEKGCGGFWACDADNYHQGDATEYIRADLAAPSAPAEGEGLDYAAIDAIRLEAFRTNDPDTKQRFLNAAGRWFQYEDCRALERYYALTALQARADRLIREAAAWAPPEDADRIIAEWEGR